MFSHLWILLLKLTLFKKKSWWSQNLCYLVQWEIITLRPPNCVTKLRVGSEVTALTLPATFTDVMGPHIRLDLQDFALSFQNYNYNWISVSKILWTYTWHYWQGNGKWTWSFVFGSFTLSQNLLISMYNWMNSDELRIVWQNLNQLKDINQLQVAAWTAILSFCCYSIC